MKLCPKCGSSYDDDKLFCKKCGTKLKFINNLDADKAAEQSVFEDKLKSDPLNLNILNDYLLFLFENDVNHKAIEIALKILVLDKNNKKVKIQLFELYIKSKNKNKAVEIGELILKSEPDNISVIESLGDLYDELEKYDKAVELYSKIITLQPENAAIIRKKALVLLKNNALEEASSLFNKFRKNGDEEAITKIYSSLAMLLNGEYEPIKDILLPVLSSTEENAYYNLDYCRGNLYLAYVLSITSKNIEEIENRLKQINIEVLKNDYSETDEKIFAGFILNFTKIKLSELDSTGQKAEIDTIKREIINQSIPYFTGKSNSVVCKIWTAIAQKQSELNLLDDAVTSYSLAVKLEPDNEQLKEKLSETEDKLKRLRKKDKRKKVVYSVVIALTLILVTAGVLLYQKYKEDKAWEQAKSINTYESYNNYTNSYPEGKYIQAADSLKEETYWAMTVQENNKLSYVNYKTLYPNGKYIQESNIRFNNLLLNEITVEKIKKDLIGKSIPDWIFYKTNEFITFDVFDTIINKLGGGCQNVWFDVKTLLKDWGTNKRYDCIIRVRYKVCDDWLLYDVKKVLFKRHSFVNNTLYRNDVITLNLGYNNFSLKKGEQTQWMVFPSGINSMRYNISTSSKEQKYTLVYSDGTSYDGKTEKIPFKNNPKFYIKAGEDLNVVVVVKLHKDL